MVAHMLGKIPYEYQEQPTIELPPLQIDDSIARTPLIEQNWIPEIF